MNPAYGFLLLLSLHLQLFCCLRLQGIIIRDFRGLPALRALACVLFGVQDQFGSCPFDTAVLRRRRCLAPPTPTAQMRTRTMFPRVSFCLQFFYPALFTSGADCFLLDFHFHCILTPFRRPLPCPIPSMRLFFPPQGSFPLRARPPQRLARTEIHTSGGKTPSCPAWSFPFTHSPYLVPPIFLPPHVLHYNHLRQILSR